MRRIIIHDPNNINDPEFAHIQQRVTKVELNFLDGTTKEMKLYFPYFTAWGEASEITNNYLSALVEHWTRYWLKIKSYQVSLGSVFKDGTEHYMEKYFMQEIPLDKVYVHEWPGGKWVDPVGYEQMKREERLKKIIKNMDGDKQGMSGENIEHDPEKFSNYLN
jgi:hypothetical protein